MVLLLFAGLFLSLIGSLPPGFISLLIAQTSIQRGIKPALWAAAGAASVETVQAWLASIAAVWVLAHPAVQTWFQYAALLVFLSVGTYLMFFAPPPKPRTEVVTQVSPWQQFGKGMLVSIFNMMAMPYWFAYCGWLKMSGWWPESPYSVVFFSVGVGLGTLSALALYAWAAQRVIERSAEIARSINRIIAVIFYLLACKILVNLYW